MLKLFATAGIHNGLIKGLDVAHRYAVQESDTTMMPWKTSAGKQVK